jgi:hypothetical protein
MNTLSSHFDSAVQAAIKQLLIAAKKGTLDWDLIQKLNQQPLKNKDKFFKDLRDAAKAKWDENVSEDALHEIAELLHVHIE